MDSLIIILVVNAHTSTFLQVTGQTQYVITQYTQETKQGHSTTVTDLYMLPICFLAYNLLYPNVFLTVFGEFVFPETDLSP